MSFSPRTRLATEEGVKIALTDCGQAKWSRARALCLRSGTRLSENEICLKTGQEIPQRSKKSNKNVSECSYLQHENVQELEVEPFTGLIQVRILMRYKIYVRL